MDHRRPTPAHHDGVGCYRTVRAPLVVPVPRRRTGGEVPVEIDRTMTAEAMRFLTASAVILPCLAADLPAQQHRLFRFRARRRFATGPALRLERDRHRPIVRQRVTLPSLHHIERVPTCDLFRHSSSHTHDPDRDPPSELASAEMRPRRTERSEVTGIRSSRLVVRSTI